MGVSPDQAPLAFSAAGTGTPTRSEPDIAPNLIGQEVTGVMIAYETQALLHQVARVRRWSGTTQHRGQLRSWFHSGHPSVELRRDTKTGRGHCKRGRPEGGPTAPKTSRGQGRPNDDQGPCGLTQPRGTQGVWSGENRRERGIQLPRDNISVTGPALRRSTMSSECHKMLESS